jgi:hypothetical protein
VTRRLGQKIAQLSPKFAQNLRLIKKLGRRNLVENNVIILTKGGQNLSFITTNFG